MSRWLVWLLIGVASCCSLLAASVWAQNESPSRLLGKVQIDDQPQQSLTPEQRQPLVLHLESATRQLSFYLQIPDPEGAQTQYRYQLSGWGSRGIHQAAGASVIRGIVSTIGSVV